MPATCVPQYVPRANTGLSKHWDPVFPHFWSWNQNLARVCARGGGVHQPERPQSCRDTSLNQTNKQKRHRPQVLS